MPYILAITVLLMASAGIIITSRFHAGFSYKDKIDNKAIMESSNVLEGVKFRKEQAITLPDGGNLKIMLESSESGKELKAEYKKNSETNINEKIVSENGTSSINIKNKSKVDINSRINIKTSN